MKAIVCLKYGSPDVLQLKEVEKPVPGEDEILIKIRTASVNPLDFHFIRGKPVFIRLKTGLLKPKNPVPGADWAGRVEKTGDRVKAFQPGDEIFGDMYPHIGSFAEYICVPESGTFAPKPAGLSFEQAAAVPAAGVTALQGLRDRGQIRSGQKVLVYGASGGVGTFAVQIAKAFGTDVTGVCSTGNLDLVRSIGADQVIDYTKEDFTRSGQVYDLILDLVGNRKVSDLLKALAHGGTCVILGYSSLPMMLRQSLRVTWISGKNGKRIIPNSNIETAKEHLVYLTDLIDKGKIVPVIDRRYSLKESADAVRYLETGHARGKVVIILETDNMT